MEDASKSQASSSTSEPLESDVFRPLTSEEESLARINSLNQQLEALADMQRGYLEFLEQTRKVAQDLEKDRRQVDDELGKMDARSKLDI